MFDFELPSRIFDDVATVERVDCHVAAERSARTAEHVRPRTEQLLVLTHDTSQ